MPNLENKVDSSQSQMDETLHRFVEGFSSPRRSPVLHSPSEQGLDYEDVSFLAREGVPLEGWLIFCREAGFRREAGRDQWVAGKQHG
jgi:hypothetical protein